MPMAISVCMLAERCFSASHMPMKNCDPDQTSTGRLSTPRSAQTIATRVAAHRHPVAQARDEIGIAKSITGMETAAANQNLRIKVRYSSSFAASAGSSRSLDL